MAAIDPASRQKVLDWIARHWANGFSCKDCGSQKEPEVLQQVPLKGAGPSIFGPHAISTPVNWVPVVCSDCGSACFLLASKIGL